MVNSFMSSRYFPQPQIIIIDSNIVLALINNKSNWKVVSILTTIQKIEFLNAHNY